MRAEAPRKAGARRRKRRNLVAAEVAQRAATRKQKTRSDAKRLRKRFARSAKNATATRKRSVSAVDERSGRGAEADQRSHRANPSAHHPPRSPFMRATMMPRRVLA